jgi:MATE family multidrug resistance protein
VALAGAVGVMAIMGSAAMSFLLFPAQLTSLLTTQQEVLTVAQMLLGIAALFAVFDGVQTVAAGALRGAGDVTIPVQLTLASNWLIGFPLGLYLAFGRDWGVSGLWWGLTSGLITVSVLLSWRFWRLSANQIERLSP